MGNGITISMKNLNKYANAWSAGNCCNGIGQAPDFQLHGPQNDAPLTCEAQASRPQPQRTQAAMPICCICPGFADRSATEQFLAATWKPAWPQPLVIWEATYQGDRVLEALRAIDPQRAIGLIGFSAGVVAALGAAQAWQRRGGRVRAVFAWDGWGVALPGGLPIYRFSHDQWTHRSSAWLGPGRAQFWADPPLAHQAFWRSPDRAWGWWSVPDRAPSRTTAATMLQTYLQGWYGLGEDGTA